jgi:hypothetical protein
MNTRTGVIATLVVVASLAPVGAAHASTGDSLTCVVDGLMSTTASTYNFASRTAVCEGVLSGVPRLATDISITSNGEYTGDVCTVGMLGDADGSATTISSGSQGFAITGLGYTIQAAAGSGEMTFRDKWAGSGALRFANGASSAGACTPGVGSLYSVQGGFTITGR